ncbi:MAG: Lrp/AsnC ligand binding domain-containing protein [Candidatus Hydrothermarchaeaceae archaeon]
MVAAGVLIKTKPGTTKEVLNTIRGKKGIAYAYAVFGRYDIVATIKDAKDIDEVARIVTESIANVDGVASTETLITANI